jgi:hypothetical protein
MGHADEPAGGFLARFRSANAQHEALVAVLTILDVEGDEREAAQRSGEPHTSRRSPAWPQPARVAAAAGTIAVVGNQREGITIQAIPSLCVGLSGIALRTDEASNKVMNTVRGGRR